MNVFSTDFYASLTVTSNVWSNSRVNIDHDIKIDITNSY